MTIRECNEFRGFSIKQAAWFRLMVLQVQDRVNNVSQKHLLLIGQQESRLGYMPTKAYGHLGESADVSAQLLKWMARSLVLFLATQPFASAAI